MGGCLIAGAFATVAAGQLWLMLAAIALTAGLAFALLKASYAVFTMAVAATVVLFLSIGRGAAIAAAEHRLEATLLGGVIALVVARVAHRPRPPAAERRGPEGLASRRAIKNQRLGEIPAAPRLRPPHPGEGELKRPSFFAAAGGGPGRLFPGRKAAAPTDGLTPIKFATDWRAAGRAGRLLRGAGRPANTRSAAWT